MGSYKNGAVANILLISVTALVLRPPRHWSYCPSLTNLRPLIRKEEPANEKNRKMPLWLRRVFLIFTILGPGLITASADNDAPGIATYSMVGSAYGYRFLWVILAITVGELVVQEMAARMGAVTGKGTGDLIRERFGVKVTTFSMFCLLLANLGTTVAQFAGIAAAGELFGISKYISVVIAGIVMSVLILRGGYNIVEKVLLVLCFASLSYVFTVFIIKPDWGRSPRPRSDRKCY